MNYQEFSSEQHVSFSLKDSFTGNIIDEASNEPCYAELELMIEHSSSVKGPIIIVLEDILCEDTIDYHDIYCKYIGEMLKLDYVITESTFEFVDTGMRYFNLLVCTLIRYLWEGMILDNHISFFENLMKHNDYTLENFCQAYQSFGDEYIDLGHQIGPPSLVKIRSYDELIKYFSTEEGINNFFINELPWVKEM